MKDEASNEAPESSTHRDEEASHGHEGEHRNSERDPYTIRCSVCCHLRILPYGLLRWALATTAAIIALALTVSAAGTCFFIKSEVNDTLTGPTVYEIGINRYKDTDGSCETYRDGVAKDLVYDDVYWKVVRYFVDIAVVVMFFFTLCLLTTGFFEYKCAGRTFFAKLAVCMAAMNTLLMASFLVFASDICMDSWSKCFLSDGSFLMMGAIAVWWIAGWLVLHIIPLGKPHDTYESLHLPSRWRSIYVQVCVATIVAAAATNGAIIAVERRD